MRVISRDIVDKNAYINSVVPVLALEEDADYAREQVVKPLLDNEYQVVLIEHTQELCQSLGFANRVRRLIGSVRCAIPVLSKSLLLARNERARQMLYFEVGLLESQGSAIYPFLADISDQQLEELIKGKPIANIQGVRDIEKILRLLGETSVPREIYLKDHQLNSLAVTRIHHARLTAIVDVWRSTLANIFHSEGARWTRGNAEFDDSIVTAMVDSLFADLNVGVLVLRFGRKETLEQEAFAPYRAESELIYFDSPAQFEKTIAPKHLEYELDKALAGRLDDEIATTIRCEFHIPVHEVLGTSFQPYLGVKNKSRWKPEQLYTLLALSGKGLAGGFVLEKKDTRIDPVGTEKRLYFTLPGPTAEIDEELRDRYGARCNFIYPK